MSLRVGLLCGRERSFPEAFLAEVNRRHEGVTAEFARLGGTRMDEACPYAVLLDRISHKVPYYRSYLKQAAMNGRAVINDPFVLSADDKFHQACVAARLGVAHPKTLVLPNKACDAVLVPTESLRNLIYPLDWDAILAYTGLPCVLKDVCGGGWRDVYVCASRDELLQHYDRSGTRTMIVQEHIRWEQYVRCLCFGRSEVLPMRYDPHARAYHDDPGYLAAALRERIVEDSLKLVRALRYDMDSVEWAVHDGVPYAIDFLNPVPDLDRLSLPAACFDWAVQRLADLVIRRALKSTPAREG